MFTGNEIRAFIGMFSAKESVVVVSRVKFKVLKFKVFEVKVEKLSEDVVEEDEMMIIVI